MKASPSQLLLALLVALCTIPPVLAETLRVGGTGSSTPLVALLFDAFRKEAPEASLEQPQPPLGSNGALKALAAGRIDLAFSGRPLKPEEETTAGRHSPFATTPFVIATSNGKRDAGFTLEELAEVYAGRLTRWDDGAPIRLVLRASFESDTLMLKSMSPTMGQAVEAAVQRPGMALGQDDLETHTLLAKTAGSLGPSTLGLLTSLGSPLAVMPVNGVTPSLEALRDGRYPWRKEMTLVLPQRPGPLTERFVAFLATAEARAVLTRADYLPAEP